MYSSSSQTPIGILQEVATKRGLVVHYEMVASEGEVHEPIYVFECKVGKTVAIGKGNYLSLHFIYFGNVLLITLYSTTSTSFCGVLYCLLFLNAY